MSSRIAGQTGASTKRRPEEGLDGQRLMKGGDGQARLFDARVGIVPTGV